MKIIAHIDADCFYVSCERVRDRSLIGKPVGVLGNQGACVIARSYEMKPFGVTVGMPIWKARQLCPEAVYVKRDFQWYGAVSHAMQDIFKSYSDRVEFYSVDESFIDFGNYEGDLFKLGYKMQNEILEKLHIPVSVGISLTRTLAKICSDKNKPFGLKVVTPENLEEFLKSTTVSEICGVGEKLSGRLKSQRIETCFDFVSTPSRRIKSLLNKPGEEIWYELQGKSILEIKDAKPQRKVISRGGSLWGHHKDPKYIFGFLMRNLERFCESLLKEEVEIGVFTLLLQTQKGECFKVVEELSDFTSDFGILTEALKRAVKKMFVIGETYSYCHLIGSPVRSTYAKQMSFFGLEDDRRTRIYQIKQNINEKHGLFTLRSASTAYANKVFKDKASDYEIVDIVGKICF